MKKSIVFGALALAGAAFAVESATVGYEQIALAANTWYLAGVQFEAAGGSELSIQDAIKGDFVATGDGLGAQIQVWNGVKLTPYYYWDMAIDGEDIVENVWGDVNMDMTHGSIVAGAGFWLKSPTAVTITFNK